MTYELALELKKAGFPQNFKAEGKTIDLKHILLPGLYIGDAKTECVYVPTLSELIEACPKESLEDDGETFTLTYVYLGYWLAGYEAYECWSFSEKGDTPEEAVARLWLALNPVINKEEIHRNPLDQNKWM